MTIYDMSAKVNEFHSQQFVLLNTCLTYLAKYWRQRRTAWIWVTRIHETLHILSNIYI